MPVKTFQKFLDAQDIKYVAINHSAAYTAQEIAASAHIPGKELAKTVIVKVNGEMAMAVLPACHRVDFDLLKEAAAVSKVELASEEEFRDKFSECELGAMPPFGNLYGMDVFVADTLAEDEEIAFNCGSHTELIQMSFKDFEATVKPKIVKFSFHR
jgi:Ala-tRNA(Pro) deacylase